MAKKKKKTTTRKRRRVSGIGGGMMTTVGGAATGGLLAKVITKFLPTTISPTIVAIGTVGAGIFLPKVIKGPFGQAMGAGMVGVGVVNTLSATGILSGINQRKPMARRAMNGTPYLRTINGPSAAGGGLTELKTVNGPNNRTGTPYVKPRGGSYAGDNDMY
jgi:hypothetical protein